MKQYSRWISIAGGVIDFKTRTKVPIVITLCRGSHIEHVGQYWTSLDPTDITGNIIEWTESEKWYNKKIIQGVWAHGCTIAGLGILNFKKLLNTWNVPIVSITDEKPNNESLKNAMFKHLTDANQRWKEFLENDQEPKNIRNLFPECNLWITCYGIALKEALEVLKYQQVNGCCLPEGLRIARIIVTNIKVPI